jgi:hypothetical protein
MSHQVMSAMYLLIAGNGITTAFKIDNYGKKATTFCFSFIHYGFRCRAKQEAGINHFRFGYRA